MASQMNASVIEETPNAIGSARLAPRRATCQCPPRQVGHAAERELARQPAADGVLGVAAVRPLEGGERARAQAEQRQLAFESVARLDMEQARPAAQPGAEPPGQPPPA